MPQARPTAIKCYIADLQQGTIEKTEEPGTTVRTAFGDIAKANILGVVVNTTENGILLDDGTGKLQVRSFETMQKPPEVGDIVLVIGRPKVYNDEIYLTMDICKKIDNKTWIAVRQQELAMREMKNDPFMTPVLKKAEVTQPASIPFKETIPPKPAIIEKIDKGITDAEKIIAFVKNKDFGKGVLVSAVEDLHIPNYETHLENLLKDGTLFEIKPGIVKLLE